MRTTVGKWGNSLGIRIPAALASAAGLGEGCDVEITLRGAELVVAPVLTLNGLLARITSDNLPELADEQKSGVESW